MVLTREQILAAPDVVIEEVDVPEWGGSVLLRTLTAHQAEEWIRRARDPETRQINFHGFMPALLALTIVDADGQTVFSETDVEALGEKSAEVIRRLYERASKLSSLGDATDEAIEDFGSAQSDVPSSE